MKGLVHDGSDSTDDVPGTEGLNHIINICYTLMKEDA